jgi:hypothetical protein
MRLNKKIALIKSSSLITLAAFGYSVLLNRPVLGELASSILFSLIIVLGILTVEWLPKTVEFEESKKIDSFIMTVNSAMQILAVAFLLFLLLPYILANLLSGSDTE